MSLINDALVDLDARQRKSSEVEELAIFNAGMPTKGGLGFRGVLLATALVGGAIFGFMLMPFGIGASTSDVLVVNSGGDVVSKADHAEIESDTNDVVSNPTGPEVAIHLAQSSVETNMAEVTPAQTAAYVANEGNADIPAEKATRLVSLSATQAIPENDDSAGNAADKSQDLDYLLLLAQQSLDNNQLTIPVNENAVYFLNKVLKVEPQNKVALTLQAQVKSLYLSQLQHALSNAQHSRAKSLLSRLQLLPIDASEQRKYERQFANSRDVEAPAKTVAYVATPQSDTADTDSKLFITPTLSSLDKDISSRAREMVARGNKYAAKKLLHTFVNEHPQSISSVGLLFDLESEQAGNEKPQQIAHMLGDSHPLKNYFSARLTSQQGDLHGAISTLIKQSPSPSIYSLHYELLAGLYQKTQQHQQAKNAYQRLLKTDATNVKYLLGYALASDARGESLIALHSYRRLLQQPKLRENISEFAVKRVSILSQYDLAGTQEW